MTVIINSEVNESPGDFGNSTSFKHESIIIIICVIYSEAL